MDISINGAKVLYTIENVPIFGTVNITQTGLYQIGNVQFSALGAGRKGIDIFISKAFAVRHRTDTKGIQNN